MSFNKWKVLSKCRLKYGNEREYACKRIVAVARGMEFKAQFKAFTLWKIKALMETQRKAPQSLVGRPKSLNHARKISANLRYL